MPIFDSPEKVVARLIEFESNKFNYFRVIRGV
jgi:hypothetical protein